MLKVDEKNVDFDQKEKDADLRHLSYEFADEQEEHSEELKYKN